MFKIIKKYFTTKLGHNGRANKDQEYVLDANYRKVKTKESKGLKCKIIFRFKNFVGRGANNKLE